MIVLNSQTQSNLIVIHYPFKKIKISYELYFEVFIVFSKVSLTQKLKSTDLYFCSFYMMVFHLEDFGIQSYVGFWGNFK